MKTNSWLFSLLIIIGLGFHVSASACWTCSQETGGVMCKEAGTWGGYHCWVECTGPECNCQTSGECDLGETNPDSTSGNCTQGNKSSKALVQSPNWLSSASFEFSTSAQIVPSASQQGVMLSQDMLDVLTDTHSVLGDVFDAMTNSGRISLPTNTRLAGMRTRYADDTRLDIVEHYEYIAHAYNTARGLQVEVAFIGHPEVSNIEAWLGFDSNVQSDNVVASIEYLDGRRSLEIIEW